MTIKLFPPQERAKNEIVKDNKVKRWGLIAPTGSGKTIIFTKTIQDIANHFNNKVAFILLTIGRGNLAEQSIEKLKASITTLNILSVSDLSSVSSLEGSVAVINWDALNKTDKDGRPINIIMKQEENFAALCEKTRQANIPIILIIDESHLYAATEKSLTIRHQYIKPNYTLEVSATPKYKKWHGSTKLTTKEVADCGLIKTDIKQNTFAKTEEGIRLGAKKLKDIIGLAEQGNIGYNPRMLVFCPNANQGDVELDQILNLLSNEFGWTEEAGEVVVWMSNRKSKDYEKCKDNSGVCKVILTKEAIDTGVDIPSIQVIVQLRPAGNRRTEMQKLGRGLRMPFQKHYGNDLDKLFFYVFDDYEVDNTDAEYVLDLLEDKFKVVKDIRDIGRRVEIGYEETKSKVVGWFMKKVKRDA
jgi:type III restriction enzyme